MIFCFEDKKTVGTIFLKKLIQNIFISWLVLMLLGGLNAAQAEVRVTYYHTDALGSTVAATDESGKELWRESYRPYGERIQHQVDTSQHSLFYTGKEHDDDTDLTYFGARYYDSNIGQFMGMDPAGFSEDNPQSFNRYTYANNNPYKFVDSDGEASVWVVFLIAAVGLAYTYIKFKPAMDNLKENNKKQAEAGKDLAAAANQDVEAINKITNGDLENIDKESFNKTVDSFENAKDAVSALKGVKKLGSTNKFERIFGTLQIGNKLREEASEKFSENNNSSKEQKKEDN